MLSRKEMMLFGIAFLIMGALLNIIVVTADHGMPARVPAKYQNSQLFADPQHHVETSTDQLTVLDDWIHVPVLGYYASPGDVLFVFGAAVFAIGLIRFVVEES